MNCFIFLFWNMIFFTLNWYSKYPISFSSFTSFKSPKHRLPYDIDEPIRLYRSSPKPLSMYKFNMTY